MTYEDKVQWLKRYRNSLHEEQELIEELEQVQAAAEHITPLLSSVPGGAGGADKLPRAVEKIMETQMRLEAQIEHTHEIRCEIEEAIRAVQDGKAQQILRRRYLQGQKWEAVAYEMHVDYRWMLRLHRRALASMDL